MVLLFVPSCRDDRLFSDEDFRDGVTTVSLDVTFSPFSNSTLTRTDNPNGKILDRLQDLCILIYDENGNLYETDKYKMPMEIAVNESDVKDDPRTDADASNGKTAESTTKSLKDFKQLRLPFGRYYIIGVANLKGGTLETLKSTKEYLTLDGLRRMKVKWDNENIINNGELLGYFTDTEIDDVPAYDRVFKTVAVNRPGMKIHAWLRRPASKITIDFDGSNLRENVTVYIKEARIYDVAYDCTLGFGAPSSTDEDKKDYNHRVKADGAVVDGFYHESPQVITYIREELKAKPVEGEDKKPAVTDGWPSITKGQPVIKDNVTLEEYDKANVIDYHSEKADGLYFYENMQDNSSNPPSIKTPVADLVNGGVAGNGDPNKAKDGIKYGTYIEVEGFYRSNADGNYSNGPIKYRFMIGKNVTDDFHAERNYHYKLTLMPRGNGNDADWHIDYNETVGFHVPNPWYVSYLYNHDAMLPFKYVAEEGWEVVGLKAEITHNPWYPSDFTEDELKDNTIDLSTPVVPDGEEEGDNRVGYDHEENRQQGNGFLSLRATNKLNITPTDVGMKDWEYGITDESKHTYLQKDANTLNNSYYYGISPSTSTIDRSKRVYLENGEKKDDSTPESKEKEAFSYEKDGNNWSFNIPLFTRAKAMIKQTGYSGNNPFVGYQRIARVKLIVTIRNKTTLKEEDKDEDVNVVQVRRVVNPKGVYRRAGNNEPFHVTMMWLGGDEANMFSPVVSRGPWRAEIIGDQNFITLDGKQTVSGSTNDQVDFTIRFNRTNVSKEDKTVRNAVVRIKYHNYTCTHLIFVRQGYEPQAISADGCEWSCFNLVAKNLEAQDPRDEGSLFKFGNTDQPIDAINNAYKVNGKEDYHIPEDFSNTTKYKPGNLIITNSNGTITDATSLAWDKITKSNNPFEENVATMADFQNMYLTSDDNHTQFGYGVLYADGATETQSVYNEAYGYCRHTANEDGSSHRGMRGMFAYYWDEKDPDNKYKAKNVFFPIGRSGYGHRKNNLEGKDGDKNRDGYGILRYACSRGTAEPLFAHVAPLFVSIYRRQGAIYYAKQNVSGCKEWDGTVVGSWTTAYGLDINYFSFDVNLISATNVSSGNDACFVRCKK